MRWPPWRRPPEESPRAGPPPAQVTLSAVGYVRSAVRRPRPRGWASVESVVEVLPEHGARLGGLERFSHLIVVFYMDLAVNAPAKPETLAVEGGGSYGIFATRSQLRPNHLGVSVVPLLGVDGLDVRVRGLDAIDGTPVLDIKPYLPAYDARPGAQTPPA